MRNMGPRTPPLSTPDHVCFVLARLTDCCDPCRKYGPTACTCWTPVYDVEQQPVPVDQAADPAVREGLCVDCAYRPKSPEKLGHPDYNGDAAELDRIAEQDRFWCHQGMRRPIYWEHPAGIRITGSPADYDPPIRDFIPHKADGSPADLCAGWRTRQRALHGKRVTPDTPGASLPTRDTPYV